MHFTNQDISNIVYKLMSWKYNLKVFPICDGLLIMLGCVALIAANSVPTGIPYPFVTVAD